MTPDNINSYSSSNLNGLYKEIMDAASCSYDGISSEITCRVDGNEFWVFIYATPATDDYDFVWGAKDIEIEVESLDNEEATINLDYDRLNAAFADRYKDWIAA